MRWLDGITDSKDVNLNNFWKLMEDGGAWCAAVHEITKSLTRLSNKSWPNEAYFKTAMLV